MHVGPTRLPVNGRIWETVAAPRNNSNTYEPSQQSQPFPIPHFPIMQMQNQNNLALTSTHHNQKYRCSNNSSFDGPNHFMRPSNYSFASNFGPSATNEGIIELRLREGIM